VAARTSTCPWTFKGKLKVFLWPDNPKDIADTDELKLVITSDKNEPFMKNVLETKGETPRVYRNTVFFLCPSESEKSAFTELLKRKIAYEHIETDRTLKLTDEQRREIGNNLKKEREGLQDSIRRLYRLLYVPAKDAVKEIDIGIPTYGEKKEINQDVYEKLRMENEILDRIAPVVIKERYLKERDYVKVQQLYDSMLKTPGERRITSPQVLEESIKQGVKQGFFGLGEIQDDGSAVCRFFKEDATVSSSETEILLKESICNAQKQGLATITEVAPPAVPSEVGAQSSRTPETMGAKMMNELALKFSVPRGKISQIMGVMNFLQSRFQSLEMELNAKDGSMSEEDYTSKIREALRQLGIDLEDRQ